MRAVALPEAMQKLIREFSRLPSIGEKSATRLAYHLVNGDRTLAGSLAAALGRAVESVGLCQQCFFLTEESRLCQICSDQDRQGGQLCVVEKPVDLVALERVGDFKGQYHVLHGVWAPLRGQHPDSMRLKELIERIRLSQYSEVILALGSTVEGDATALYIARLIRELGVPVSRLAQGLPKGGELEYADDVTLARAFAGRNQLA